MRNSLAKQIPVRSKGFTLLELLVVIAIIGILAGLMFPAVTGALKRAEVVNAQNTAYNVKNAISSYFTEYRKYPVDTQQRTSETAQPELQTDEELMDVLLGSDSEAEEGGLNPRKVAYYSGKQARQKSSTEYIKGVVLDDNGGGTLWDPFGRHYQVRLDLDYNNRVERPDWDESGDSKFLPESILIWSLGKSEEDDKDNITTW
ncbi:MAG: type II secretion system protein [Verrucomicrobiales bacterium]|nr:type II secretion system protein [Verrucomicrobiales bacterium]